MQQLQLQMKHPQTAEKQRKGEESIFFAAQADRHSWHHLSTWSFRFFSFLSGREHLCVLLLLLFNHYSLSHNEVYIHNSHWNECSGILPTSASSSTWLHLLQPALTLTQKTGAFLSYIHKPIINHTKNTSNTAIILLQIHSPQNAKQQIKVKPEVPASV